MKMKRNDTRQSPYQRHRKTPYRYSELLQKWTHAIKNGQQGLASQLGRAHTEQFGPTNHEIKSIWDRFYEQRRNRHAQTTGD